MNMSPGGERRAFSLRLQLVVAFGGLAVMLAAFLSLALGRLLIGQAEAGEASALSAVSANVAKSLAEDLAEKLRLTSVLASSPTLWRDGLQSPAIKDMLGRAQASDPDNSWIGVSDTNGIVRAATSDVLVGQDVSARPWFRPGLVSAHLGDVHYAKLLASYLPRTAAGEPPRFVDFSAPILLHGKAAGVLAIHGNWEWADRVVQRLLPESESRKNVRTFIFNNIGHPIYPSTATQAKGDVIEGWVVGKAPSAESVQVLQWDDGETYLTATFRLPETSPGNDLGWTIATREPIAEVYRVSRNVAFVASGLGVAAASVAMAFAWMLANRLSHPMTEIARAAKRVAEGGDTNIPTNTSCLEVAELSSALGEMTSKLVASNRHLEQSVRDRTMELELANSELARLARVDALTGLPNRREFDERAVQLIASARRVRSPLCLILVDADHFKKINDTHGHATGDATLVALAGAIRNSLRESDVVARIGGEEFAVLLPATSTAGAMRVASMVIEAVRAVDVPQVGRITVSCGVAEFGDPDADARSMFAKADRALYEAKSRGRNQAVLALSASGDVFAPEPTE